MNQEHQKQTDLISSYNDIKERVARTVKGRAPTCRSRRYCHQPCETSLTVVTFRLGIGGDMRLDTWWLGKFLDYIAKIKVRVIAPTTGQTVSDLSVATRGENANGAFSVRLGFMLCAGHHINDAPIYNETVDVSEMNKLWVVCSEYLEGLTRRVFAHQAGAEHAKLPYCYLNSLGLLEGNDKDKDKGPLTVKRWDPTDVEDAAMMLDRAQKQKMRDLFASIRTGWDPLDLHIGRIKQGTLVVLESNRIDARLVLTEILALRACRSGKQVRYYHTQGASHDGWVRRISHHTGIAYTDVLAMPDDMRDVLSRKVARDVYRYQGKDIDIIDLAATDPAADSRLNPLLIDDLDASIVRGQHHVVILDTLRSLRFRDDDDAENTVHSPNWLWRVVRRLRKMARDKNCIIIVASEPLKTYGVNPNEVRIEVGLSLNLIGDNGSTTMTTEVQGSNIMYLKTKFDVSEIDKCRMHYIDHRSNDVVTNDPVFSPFSPFDDPVDQPTDKIADLAGYGMM